MTIEKVKQCEYVESVERTTKYEWSDIEYWKITTLPGAYNDQNALSILLDLNVFEDNGNELLVPVGDVFQ